MNPWKLAEPGTEHAHQRAVFAWANCAARLGYYWADMPEGYQHSTTGNAPALTIAPVPELARLFAIHNQGHGDVIRGARAKAEGVKAGVPDIMLPVPRVTYEDLTGLAIIIKHGLFIELKKPLTGRERLVQSEWIAYLNSEDYCAVTCYGWLSAVDEIKGYMRNG